MAFGPSLSRPRRTRRWAAGGAARRAITLAQAALRRHAGLAPGLLIALGLWVAAILFVGDPALRAFSPDQDARAYWLAQSADPYRVATVGTPGAYLYSPAFLGLLAPLRALPWQAFVAAWTLVLLVAAAYLAGPWFLGPAVALALVEIWGGNITLLLAVAIVVGLRWPAAWAFVLLTKVTPGIGLIWFLVRREWHALAVALGATVAVAAVSLVLAPSAWSDWAAVLLGNADSKGTWAAIQIPLLPRLPLAIAIVAWGARTGRRWTLAVGCLLAMPVIWYGSLTLLLAALPLTGMRDGRWDRAVLATARRISTSIRERSDASDRTGTAGADA